MGARVKVRVRVRVRVRVGDPTPNPRPHPRQELAHAHEEARGLMLSTEDLDLPETDLEDLVSALHDYNLTTVVMYRPFYEWMISVHGQNA